MRNGQNPTTSEPFKLNNSYFVPM